MGRAERAIARVALLAAGAALTVMSVMTVLDVTGRSFGAPLAAATELTEALLLITIFCALPVVTRRGDHISIDILDAVTPRWLRRVQAVFAGLLGAVGLGAASWRVWELAVRAQISGDVTPYLQIPVWPFVTFTSVMCAVTALAFLITAIRPPSVAP
jgi:TRAP-type C4-dicarboxylate transport system permease small subunit